MRTVLLIGRDDLAPFAAALEAEGFAVSAWPPGEEAPDGAEAFDVVVLDLASLGEDPAGKRYLEGSQRGEGPPVIGLIEQAQLGAADPWRETDDFMLKEAPPEELAGRVRQALWKQHRIDTRNTLRCGDLVLDLANYTVHVAGRPIDLTFKEYELLRFLATNPDRVFTRDALLNKVWGYDFYGGARTVDVHVRRLRSKIEERHAYIETVRNVGYRFRAP